MKTLTVPGKIVKVSGALILSMGCLAVASASGFGTVMFVGCILLGTILINETHRSEYRR